MRACRPLCGAESPERAYTGPPLAARAERGTGLYGALPQSGLGQVVETSGASRLVSGDVRWHPGLGQGIAGCGSGLEGWPRESVCLR